MRTILTLLSVFAAVAMAISVPAASAGPPAWRVTYLANEGVLLEAGGKKVLVDALFGDGIKGYPVVPSTMRLDLESARGKFSQVDLVLATHEHSDHFSVLAVAHTSTPILPRCLSRRQTRSRECTTQSRLALYCRGKTTS